jgi:hypothetical protein
MTNKWPILIYGLEKVYKSVGKENARALFWAILKKQIRYTWLW